MDQVIIVISGTLSGAHDTTEDIEFDTHTKTGICSDRLCDKLLNVK